MKKEFLYFVNELMKANPELTETLMTDDIRAYLDLLKDVKDEKPVITENGLAKDVADQIGISSRGVSGAFRKLVNDGFCEKIGKDPVIYSLTEKGKNFKMIEGENN